MTPDERRPHDDELRSPLPPGVARRTAVTAAWTTPVVAAAVAAPGASASPAPVVTSTFVGVSVDTYAVGSFGVTAYINMTGITGSTVQLKEETWVDIVTDHDVSHWNSRFITIGPRAARLVVPVGPYIVDRTYRIGGQTVSVSFYETFTSQLSAEPKGRFTVTATVTRGPVYLGPDPGAAQQFGATSATTTVPN
ncbi:hypothetical protein EDF54_1963 [Rathayibacter sp. PhB93]|uniref:hypothetical protein n=1 Tax=unclassified Rathayibacter TaxID=2609250 RepID=UPI000F9EF7D6|nr:MULTISPECIES: hypothetical protein [unclassified Rathayibacter]ROQ05346.1 hypothetical protein EDF54_1963 [Rathayibacter sp. PhB93]TDQ12583.1 hypothetical protein EDF17_2444 [Rathayibacter sp. PhB1]